MISETGYSHLSYFADEWKATALFFVAQCLSCQMQRTKKSQRRESPVCCVKKLDHECPEVHSCSPLPYCALETHWREQWLGWTRTHHTHTPLLESTVGWGTEKRTKKSQKLEHNQLQTEMDGALCLCKTQGKISKINLWRPSRKCAY